jgi:hypothetical protein
MLVTCQAWHSSGRQPPCQTPWSAHRPWEVAERRAPRGLAAVSFFRWGTGARGASMQARSTTRSRCPHGFQPQEKVTRRTSTSTSTPSMRAVGAGGRRDSSGAAWRHGGERGLWGGGGEGCARWECHRLFYFILRAGERMNVKRNGPIRLVVN